MLRKKVIYLKIKKGYYTSSSFVFTKNEEQINDIKLPARSVKNNAKVESLKDVCIALNFSTSAVTIVR